MITYGHNHADPVNGYSWLKSWLGDNFNFYVLAVVGGIIAAGVIASLVANRGSKSAPESEAGAPT